MSGALLRILFVLCFANSLAAFSQGINVDSSLAIWNDPNQSDSLRMEAIHAVAWHGYINTKPDSAFYYAQLMFDFASAGGYRQQTSVALNTMGAAQYYRGHLTEAIEYYTQSIEFRSEADNPVGVANLLNNLASIYYSQGDYARAIQNLTQSLQIKENLEDTFGMVNTLSNVGAIYRRGDNHEKALEYFLKSLELAEELDNPEMIANALNSIGVTYKDQGDDAYAKMDSAKGNQMFSHALVHYQRSLAIHEEMGNTRGTARTLNNIGNLLFHQENFDEALEHHNRSLELKQKVQDQSGVAVSLNNIANIYRKTGRIEAAIANSQQALKIAQELGVISVERDATEALYRTYLQNLEYEASLQMYERFILLRDSINSEENQKEIMHQRFKYDFDKKEALNAAEQEKKDAITSEKIHRQNLERNTFLGGFGLMLLLAGIFYVQRTRIAREKKRSEELLLNILPSETARELKTKGYADTKSFDEVSVLFTDFKGFTQLSEKMEPHDLVAEINECFSAFDRIMEKHGVEKIKTIGDAYMAAGGLPTSNTTHAEDVVNAALEIQQFMHQRAEKLKSEGLPYFEIRIGIHTGPVVAGIVGIKKFQYDIWGDTVNTASRMESSGEAGKVNISADTYSRINHLFNCTYRGEIEAKGKGKVGMYFVDHAQ